MNIFGRIFSSIKSSEREREENAVGEEKEAFTQSEINPDIPQKTRAPRSHVGYVEFTFAACLPELLNIEDSDWETDFNGNEIFDTLALLSITADRELLIKQFEDLHNSDVEVFHSANDIQVFAYFDLDKDPTDQNDMFLFGLRCEKKDEELIIQKLLDIYRKLKTTGAFEFRKYGHTLFDHVFYSHYHFYENNYNSNKRKINFHKSGKE
ncbi:hypothetical protein [Desertivirga arenae]|uniref:hypothetical protein n=1 Tax=Desertivirga arenae TaxID=2810309 RepID=UPI001A95CC1F|nr:hypothetical protein [Pedobacter sp. SYSU D00823]